MAIHTYQAASAQGVYIATSTPDLESAFTVSMWIRLTADVDDWGWAFCLSTLTTKYGTDRQLFGVGSSGVQTAYFCEQASSEVNGSNLNVGQWYHVGIIRESSSLLKVYLDGNLDITHTGDVSGSIITGGLSLGADQDDLLEQWTGDIASVKVWSENIGVNRLSVERMSYIPKHFSNLEFFWPLFAGTSERLIDYSGNGNDLTLRAVTDASGPPVPWGFFAPGYTPAWSAKTIDDVSLLTAIDGTTAWGHDTGVVQNNTRNFTGTWKGTGSISGSGDSETLVIPTGNYMDSEVVNTGAVLVSFDLNHYGTGDNAPVQYKTSSTRAGISAASWTSYTAPFTSSGYVQIRIQH